MFPRKLLIIALVCSAPVVAGKALGNNAQADNAQGDTAIGKNSPVSITKKGSDEIRAAAQILSLYSHQLDCEQAGYIQTGEADEHFAPIFLSNDIDNSRSLSRTELMKNSLAPNQELLGVAFSKMDRDADGGVSADELRLYLNDAITTVDSDADGDVYPIEYEHAIKTGTVLKHARTSVNSKKKTERIPPWVRHMNASKHNHDHGYEKASDKLQSAESSPAPTTTN